MINIVNKQECCGCEACVQVCPKHCICFREDEEGFFYPHADKSECIDCGLCEKVCPFLHESTANSPLDCYAAKNTDESIRDASSSGGVFTLLAEQTIREGGVVFGAKFTADWSVAHDYAETIEEVAAFRTSKYVQSRIGDSFKNAKDFLRQGRKVLFSGTPCQIAALRNYLKKDSENLLTVDIICHGVPSPGVWQRYLMSVAKNVRKDKNTVSSPLIPSLSERDALHEDRVCGVKSISFRDKRIGWKKYSFALTLAETSVDGKQNTVSLSSIHHDNAFMQAFLSNMILRPSCYSCPAKGGRSGADITLADYWGIDKQMPDYDDDRGISLVLINTERGKESYGKLNADSRIVSAEDALACNPSFQNCVKPHRNRKKFFHKYASPDVDIVSLMSKLSRKPFYRKVIGRVKHIVKRCIGICGKTS